MKEALRHFITKTSMLNFLLVQTILFVLCYAFTPFVSDIDFEWHMNTLKSKIYVYALKKTQLIWGFFRERDKQI